MCGWIRATDSEKVPVTNRHYVFRAVLVLAGALLVWAYAICISLPSAGVFHDDGIYVVTARALAEGQGYRIISLPESPPQTKYPILFPWLLSLIWRIAPVFPDNLPLLRIVPVAATVVWLWLSWQLLLKCRAPRPAVIAVVALTAASPWVVYLGTSLLSETLFAALLTGSLLFLTKLHEDSPPVGRVCALAGLLAGACFLTRTAGIAVVAAGFAWLLMNGRRVGAVIFGVAAASLVVPWALWVLSHTGANAESSYYSASIYGSWNVVSHYAWPEKFAVVAMNTMQSILAPLAVWSLGATPWLAVPAVLLGRMHVARNVAHANAPRHLVRYSLRGHHHAVGMASCTVSRSDVAIIPMACVRRDSPGTSSAGGACGHGRYRHVVRGTLSHTCLTLARRASCRGEPSPQRTGIDSRPYSIGFVERRPRTRC